MTHDGGNHMHLIVCEAPREQHCAGVFRAVAAVFGTGASPFKKKNSPLHSVTSFRQAPGCTTVPEACTRLLAKFGELWQSLANFGEPTSPCAVHLTCDESLPDIHQSSGEGPPHSPEFRWRCLLYMCVALKMWPNPAGLRAGEKIYRPPRAEKGHQSPRGGPYERPCL